MGTHPIFESDFDCLTEMSWIFRRAIDLYRERGSVREIFRQSRYRRLMTLSAMGGLGFCLYTANNVIKENEEIFKKAKPYKEATNPFLAENTKHYRDLDWFSFILKGLGFGDDWMRELDWESRLKVSNWPWQVWLEYNAFPFRWVWMTQHEDLDRSTNNALYTAEICPDCYRLVGGCILTFLLLRWTLTGLEFSITNSLCFVALVQCFFGLIAGNSSGFIFEGSMVDGGASCDGKVAVNDSRDLAYTAKDIAHKRWRYGMEQRWTASVPNAMCLQQIQQLEWIHHQRVLSMQQVDEYVSRLSQKERKQLGIDEWEYGRDFPEVEQIHHIKTQGHVPLEDISTPIVFDKPKEDMSEIELFMMQLEQQLDKNSKKS